MKGLLNVLIFTFLSTPTLIAQTTIPSDYNQFFSAVEKCTVLQCELYKAEIQKLKSNPEIKNCFNKTEAQNNCNQIALSKIMTEFQKRSTDLFGKSFLTTAVTRRSEPTSTAFEALDNKTSVMVFIASANKQGEWSDVNITKNGQFAMTTEVLQNFCRPHCPKGNLKLGISFTADLLNKPMDLVLKELQAIVKSAKENGLYFVIHVNHEWIFTPGRNPFEAAATDWAEYTNWNTPLEKFYVGWSKVPSEIGLKCLKYNENK